MEPVKPSLPSLELLRGLTDEHVLRALMREPRLTRAELAAATGISKPTAGESVRRLVAAGLVADTGQRTAGGRGRGRVGSYYALTPGVGLALAVSIAPEGIVAECVNAHGEVVSRAERSLPRQARPAQVAAGLRAAASQATEGRVAEGQAGGGPVRLAVVSAADPVDRASGRMVHLPDSPFLLGDLDPVAILAPLVTGPVTVDNDVNWAARAERTHAAASGAAPLDDFAYVYLGEGLGCAVISDGEVRRGRHGLAGEIAHLLTAGPDGRAISLIEVFGQLGLRQPGATAIDTPRLLAAVTGSEVAGAGSGAEVAGVVTGSEVAGAGSGAEVAGAEPGPGVAAAGSGPEAVAIVGVVARAVAGAIAAAVALADPAQVVLGGPWGCHPVVVRAIAAAVTDLPRPVPVRPASLTAEPSLTGARADALARLRAAIIARAQP